MNISSVGLKEAVLNNSPVSLSCASGSAEHQQVAPNYITQPLKDSNPVNLNNNQYTFRLKDLDYIPIISIASGTARAAFGLLQIAAAPIQETVSLVSFIRSGFQPLQDSSSNDGESLSLRGEANFIRGSIAMYPILGNITVYLFDHKLEKDWEFRLARSVQWII